jgi:hypothetical protein
LNLRRRALLVFFTSLDDALLAETFEREVPILARRHVVLVNTPQPPGLKPLFTDASSADLDSLYSGLSGQMIANRLRQLRSRSAIAACGSRWSIRGASKPR